MFKIAAVVWIMLATTLAGIAMLVVVSVPSLADQAATLIPLACGSAVALAVPLSYVVARRIGSARTA